VLPTCQRYGIGTLVWSPLGQGLLTGHYLKGKLTDTHGAGTMPQHFNDGRKLDVVEQLVPLAEKAGLPMTHLAMAFGGRRSRAWPTARRSAGDPRMPGTSGVRSGCG
jgi:aryl-alcohol dehydrogenase-like predicted oxidoreductase